MVEHIWHALSGEVPYIGVHRLTLRWEHKAELANVVPPKKEKKKGKVQKRTHSEYLEWQFSNSCPGHATRIKLSKEDNKLVEKVATKLASGDFSEDGHSDTPNSSIDIDNAFVVNKPDMSKVNEKLVRTDQSFSFYL